MTNGPRPRCICGPSRHRIRSAWLPPSANGRCCAAHATGGSARGRSGAGFAATPPAPCCRIWRPCCPRCLPMSTRSRRIMQVLAPICGSPATSLRWMCWRVRWRILNRVLEMPCRSLPAGDTGIGTYGNGRLRAGSLSNAETSQRKLLLDHGARPPCIVAPPALCCAAIFDSWQGHGDQGS